MFEKSVTIRSYNISTKWSPRPTKWIINVSNDGIKWKTVPSEIGSVLNNMNTFALDYPVTCHYLELFKRKMIQVIIALFSRRLIVMVK